MEDCEIHLELLLGKKVLDSEGKSVGRIEEVIAVQQGDEWVIQEYLIGFIGLLHRFSARDLSRALLRMFRVKEDTGYRVPWDKLDLTDPDNPRLKCPLHELETFITSPEPER